MELHLNQHPLQQQQQNRPAAAAAAAAPPPPPPPHKPLADPDVKKRPLVPLSFANGTLKKHRPLLYPTPPHRPASPPQGHHRYDNHVVYRECMKNHAASLGGHALDGCGEFMPSPDSNPADPTSLTCAACGCHRNFHRRVLHGGAAVPDLLPHREDREVDDGPAAAAAEENDGDEAVDDEDDDHSPPPPRPPPPQSHAAAAAHQYYSAPHMLMALSAGQPGGPVGSSGSAPAAAQVAGGTGAAAMGGGLLPRKRFRTKFSQDQKDRMQELSERLGWRMQKRDEALVEQCCRQIGVNRGVFKVWMHNNKHNFVGGPSSRRAGSGAVGVGIGGGVGGVVVGEGRVGGGGGEGTSSSGGVIGGGIGGTAGVVNGGDEQNGVRDVGGGGGGDERNGVSGGGGGHGLNSSSPSS